MRIVSILSKLLKTVGLLAVRLDLAKLRLKNWKEKSHFRLKSEFRIFEECHTSLISLLNFQNLLYTSFLPKCENWSKNDVFKYRLFPFPFALR